MSIKKEIDIVETKSYRDYIFQAIRRGQKEYIPYTKHLGKNKMKPFNEDFRNIKKDI